jgi:hypothetical protein
MLLNDRSELSEHLLEILYHDGIDLDACFKDMAELVHEDAPHWGYGGVTFEKCMV